MIRKWKSWLTADTDRMAYLLFFLMALIFTSPYWLDGKLWVGSSDNHYHLIPNSLFTLFSLKEGSLGLWNPYLLTGIDFTTSSHNYISNPLMWPLYLLSGDGFLEALNFKVGIDYFLIGLFSYWFLKEEVGDKKWSLVGAISYQIGGFSLFAFTTYPYAQLLWLIPLTLYWVWTFARRSSLVFVLGFSMMLTVITLSMNITYIVGTYLTLGILILKFTVGLNPQVRKRFVGLAVLCLGVMALLTVWRWLPIAESLFFRGTRLVSAIPKPTSGNIYYISKAVIAEVFGINISESLNLLSPLKLQGHAQFHGLPYMGVIPFLLALIGVFFVSKARFWAVYFVVSILWFLGVAPIAFLIDLLAKPFIHEILSKISIPIPFAVLVAYGGIWLEAKLRDASPSEVKNVLSLSYLTWIFFSLMGIVVWLYPKPEAYGAVKAVWLFLALILGGLILKFKPGTTVAGILILSVTTIALVWKTIVSRNLDVEHYILSVFRLSTLPILLSAILVLVMAAFRLSEVKLRVISAVLLVACFAVCLVPLPIISLDQSLTENVFRVGLSRFTILLLIFVLIVRWIHRGRVAVSSLVVMLLALTFFDLAPANKNFTRQIWDFYQLRPMYPRPFGLDSRFSANRADEPMDTENYRLSWPHGLLKIPWVETTNTAMIYGVHMYGGLNSDVPRRLGTLFRHFEPTEPASSGISTFYNSDRLFDILGVKYTQDDNKKLVVRPGAVPRFAFFEEFEHLPSQDMTSEMSRDSWSPRHTLLVHDLNREIPKSSGRRTELKMLKYSKTVNEKITVEFEADSPGYILFNDGYDPSWTVKVDGQTQNIHVANHNFMATAIKTAGFHKVEFEFKPKLFLKTIWISVSALILFLSLWVFLFFKHRKPSG